MKRFVPIALILAGALLSACEPGPNPERPHYRRSLEVRTPAGGCSSFVVPNGFGLGWEKFNHRVAKWSVRLTHQPACRPDRLEVTHVGGIFSTSSLSDDRPFVKFSYQPVDDRDGKVRAARVTIQDVVGVDGVVHGTERLTLDELGLRPATSYVAMVEGLHYDTGIAQGPQYPSLYNPSRGYTTRGMGADVDVAGRGDAVDLDYEVRLDIAPTPERPFMNSALVHARIGVLLDVLVVAVDDTDVLRSSVGYTFRHEWPLPLAAPQDPTVDSSGRAFSLNGDPGKPAGFYGLTGFDFRLDFDTDCDHDTDCSFGATCNTSHKCDFGFGPLGEYMREYAVGLEMTDYDRPSGHAKFQVDGYASNASSLVAYYPLRYRFTASMAWVQTKAAGPRKTLEHVFDTGRVELPLDLDF